MNRNGLAPRERPFSIVGIGASAGGLVALEQFFSQVPPDSGLAYVIVQHLDPKREGMLVELLQRHTPLPVAEVQDRTLVEPNHVYVIPPGRDLSLLKGVLHLMVPPELRGLRLPIDFFFKSLADDQQQNSIGVILSGMGSDGTQGLRAIRQAAGACFVQTPASAQFDSMPRSALDAGVADVVAPAEELPLKIMAYAGRSQLAVAADVRLQSDQKDDGFLDKVIVLLRNQTGHDFSFYKRSTILRRVERRMGLHQLPHVSEYLRYLRENPDESELLFNELLIGVTSFFRDSSVWNQLKNEVLPVLLARHPQGAALRAWVPGCSTGEEAYSLAMVFKEALELAKPEPRFTLQIFASDLDRDAIATARNGIYPRSIAADVSEERLARFFVEDAAGYRINNEIREMVIFAEHNLVVDPPFTKLDLLSCRNLLIYLEAELQATLMQLFHYSLGAGGFLLLGSAESIGAATELFAPLPGKSRLYRRLDAPDRALRVGVPAAFMQAHGKSGAGAAALTSDGSATTPSLKVLVETLVLQRYAPAAVLVTEKGDALYFSGKTGGYLEPAAGKPSLNLFAMARDGLSQALSEAFHRALRDKTLATRKNIKISSEIGVQYVDVVVQPLQEPAALRGLALIVFFDVPKPRHRLSQAKGVDLAIDGTQVETLLQALRQSREDAKSMREEMQTTQEELRSSNEELQSLNEELQSANEELTTSKEEMQSMNEELQTVNYELQAKVADLARASNDMKNLLDSTEIATLFLDDALHVRRFTPQTTRVIKLIPGDMGRPITDIVSDLVYPELVQDAHDVLRTLVFCEKDVPTVDDRWYKVRTMPYRTQENRIDGLVITFSDISKSKKLEAELRATQARLAAQPDNSKPQGNGDGIS
ncbi:chemotaxis protein CheB [Rhodoferax ferrireducens]|uniref:chemotaxis protein CheB n=1 Tax=Rhodoferax ferrireducens TaxID=192843 RepID=UPI00298D7B36|nr:chemotaxis protein CheB [Rhodoferax ferrireducens]WPC65855.1 chemotaxis protein CheB [Rhodoferax ferrireducens]